VTLSLHELTQSIHSITICWGEGQADEHTIEVQPPGTPAVGMTFMRAYQVCGGTERTP